jgi:hypothetical protein
MAGLSQPPAAVMTRMMAAVGLVRIRRPLTAEGVIGAAFSVIHARLLERHPQRLVELLGPLMAMIVLPYRGQAAAARELACPAPEPGVAPVARARLGALTAVAVGRARVPFRLTVRTHRVLCAVAELGGRGGV